MLSVMNMLRTIVGRVAAHGRAGGLAAVAAGFVAGSLALDPAHADPAPTLLWERKAGSMEEDYATAVAVDSVGNIVSAGQTYGSIGRRGNEGADAFVVKYSPQGAVKWRRQPGPARWENLADLAIDVADNVVVVGETNGAVGGPKPRIDAGFVVKYSPDGTVQWKRQFEPRGCDRASAVATDAAGNIVVAGNIGADCTIDDMDVFVIKYGPDGAEQWRRILASPNSRDGDVAGGIATDAAGNIIIVGSTYGALGGANQSGQYAEDTFIAAYAADGTLKWIEQPGARGSDGGGDLAIDATGRIFVVGRQENATGMPQGYLAAFSAEGAELWRRGFGGTSSDGAHGVALDASGNVIICSTEFYEDFVASYTAVGALQWKLKVLAGNSWHSLYPATDTAGHVVIGSTVSVRPGRGYWDGYVAKYALP